MAKLPHLPLVRLEKTLDRRRVPAPVAPPARESAGAHAASITAQIDAVTKDQQALPKIEGINPELILKVRLSAPIQEDTWRTAGFKVLAQEPFMSGDIERLVLIQYHVAKLRRLAHCSWL